MLDDRGRLIVADALESVTFLDKEIVVKEGDPGEHFYIIMEGIVGLLLQRKLMV
jgi:cAMP-dependent protein kinase regulator